MQTSNERNQGKERDWEAEARNYQRHYIGERYVGASLSQILLPVWAESKIAEWMNNPKGMLVYLGNPGIGKTRLCASLFAFALKRFGHFRYYNERELMTRLREVISGNKGDYLVHLKLMIDDPLIFLDDIGSERHTDFREDILFDTIDQRYNSMRPIVITGNYSIEEIKKVYHPRVTSRLLAKENTIIEILDGEDYRQR